MSQGKSREQALELRTRLKSKKPTFRRQESWRYKRVSQIWRRPDGVDSKMRKKIKGWPKSAAIGYRGPRKARHLHPSGFEEVLVRNVDDLDKVNSETQAIRIAHVVGLKKRAEISIRADERHIHILNPLPKEKPAEEVATEEEAVEEETKAKSEEKEESLKTETEAKEKEKAEEVPKREEAKEN